MISRAVHQALEEDRANRKHGRSDQGRGSERLGEILRSNRLEAGFTQKELAEAAGLHSTTIGKIENGERGMSLHTFSRLAQELSLRGDGFVWEVIDEVATWPSS